MCKESGVALKIYVFAMRHTTQKQFQCDIRDAIEEVNSEKSGTSIYLIQVSSINALQSVSLNITQPN